MLGIVLVFLSGGVFLKPTSLWNFMIAFAALISGYKLIAEQIDSILRGSFRVLQ